MFYNHQANPSHRDYHQELVESSGDEEQRNHPSEHQSYTYNPYMNGLYSNASHELNHHHDHHHHAMTTLYQNRSVSIINCEYKLREKYPHMMTLIFFFVIYIIIILLGSSLFMAFEAKAEQRLRDQILNKQHIFLEQNQCVDPKELKQFIKSVIITYDKGVNLALLNDLVDSLMITSLNSEETSIGEMKSFEDESKIAKKIQENIPSNKNISKAILIDKTKNSKPDNVVEEIIVTERKDKEGTKVIVPAQFIVPMQMSNWEFGSSMTYVASVVTTIGYGHVTPITNEGKILTIVFGAVSIPCTLLFLSIIISMIRDGPIKQIEVWLIKFFGYFTEEVTLLKIRFLHLFLVTIFLFSLLIILPAFLFNNMESEWTLLDSFYYCFITVTTVGLGDYVPGQNGTLENRTWYLISIVAYMYISLCLMMLWIALVLRIPYFNFKTFLVIEEPELLERKMMEGLASSNPHINHIDDEKTPLIASTSHHSASSSSSTSSPRHNPEHLNMTNQDRTYQIIC